MLWLDDQLRADVLSQVYTWTLKISICLKIIEIWWKWYIIASNGLFSQKKWSEGFIIPIFKKADVNEVSNNIT